MVNARLKQEFIYSYSLSDRIFMVCMLIMQIIVFIAVPSSWITIVCGIAGVLSVVLCAKGKLSFYYIGLIQILVYGYFAWQEGLHNVVLINVFYLLTTIWGIFTWGHHMDKSSATVITKKMLPVQWILLAVVTLIVTAVFGYTLAQTGMAQAYMGAALNVVAIFAQIMMIARYREHWIWWFAVNGLSLALWISSGNWTMIVMYSAWTINCVYGWITWTKLLPKGEE